MAEESEKKVLVRLENVDKAFGKKYIIRGLNLDVFDGEFLTLLGPSGCGKTDRKSVV